MLNIFGCTCVCARCGLSSGRLERYPLVWLERTPNPQILTRSKKEISDNKLSNQSEYNHVFAGHHKIISKISNILINPDMINFVLKMPPVWESTTCEDLILTLRRPTCQSWHIKPFYPCKARNRTNKQTRYFSALTAERELLAALLRQNDEKIPA